jgi:hypothetical protein
MSLRRTKEAKNERENFNLKLIELLGCLRRGFVGNFEFAD